MASKTENGLQVSVEEVAAWGRKLVITVPVERVRSERQRVAKRVSEGVQIPGFRKGKVPRKIIENRYGANIDRETRDRLIRSAFREAVDEKDLEPISEPRVGNVSFDPDSDLTFEVSFEIWPEITLDRIAGFRVTRPEVQVNPEQLEEQLEEIRRQNTVWRRVDRSPELGDTVSVDIAALDGSADEEPEPRSYRFVLGEDQAIPDVEEAIMTLDPGGSGTFEVTFPDDIADEERRGRTQDLQIELKEVLEPEMPELNDELAQQVGDFEDVEELRNAVEEDLRRHEERQAEAAVERQLIDQIISANPFEVPESMVDGYLDAMIRAPEDADPEKVRKAQEEARSGAVWGIKRMLVVRRIARDHDLEASEDEVRERIEAIAERAGRPVREVRSQLAKSDELEELRRRVTEEKVFAYLKEQSEISETGE